MNNLIEEHAEKYFKFFFDECEQDIYAYLNTYWESLNKEHMIKCDDYVKLKVLEYELINNIKRYGFRMLSTRYDEIYDKFLSENDEYVFYEINPKVYKYYSEMFKHRITRNRNIQPTSINTFYHEIHFVFYHMLHYKDDIVNRYNIPNLILSIQTCVDKVFGMMNVNYGLNANIAFATCYTTFLIKRISKNSAIINANKSMRDLSCCESLIV